MLTGKPPIYETKDRIQRLSKSRFLEVEPITKVDPEIPRYVTAIVNKAMELNPAERYQTPAEMLVDLQAAMEKLNEPYTPAVAEEAARRAARQAGLARTQAHADVR